MILKLILSTLELDLSTYEFSMIEENNWINDKVSSKYTYPVEIDLTPDQNVALKNITELNLVSYDTVLDGQFYAMGLCHDCVFEIERHIGKKLSGQIRYGLEEFPNFNKQLSELPLEVFDLGTSIFAYAETIISQTWPAVNFNFPQVITDKFDTGSDEWGYFEGIINNYKAGNFLINEYNAGTDEQINRNIMQPLPYMLHILEKGFEDAGHSLAGEILTDPEFKKATIYALSSFYSSFSETSASVTITTDQFISIHPSRPDVGIYKSNVIIPQRGRYKVAGNAIIRGKYYRETWTTFSTFIKVNNKVVWSGELRVYVNDNYRNYKEIFLTFDVNFDINSDLLGDLEFSTEQLKFGIVDGVQDDAAMIFDYTLTQLAKYDASGNIQPSLLTPNKINLQKCVPNMNFGEFVTAIARWKNYGIIVRDGVVTMDKKVAKLQPNDTINNLVPFEAKEPERNFNHAKTFTLGFFEVDNTEYKFPSIFIDKNGYKLSPFVKKDDTEEFIINALPLPLKQKGEIITAHGFLDDDSKALVVLYDGLTGSLNLADNPSELSIVNVYNSSHQDWFNFLLNSIRTVWSFATHYEKIYQLKVSDIIYAYRQYHIIRRLTRKNTKLQIIETEIELESLD